MDEGLICSVCGGDTFVSHPVLWDNLVAEWQLSPDERAYVDRQQGTACTRCGANLRSIALSNAILHSAGSSRALTGFAASTSAASLVILEINEAGTLSPILRGLSGHTMAAYPEIDMHALPYPDGNFDLVIHSDTLEHVAQPIRALSECYRVLRAGGSLCFTVPTIIGRLTRSRAGLAKSFHGSAATGSDDYVVHTEFGADMWTFVIAAGFRSVMIHTTSFPDATAMSAQK